MAASARRLVVAGGESGKDAILDDRDRPAAVDSATTVVHEIVELDAAGALLPDGEWHHDPQADGSLFRIVTLKPVEPGVERDLHASPTVDVGVVLSGSVELAVPNGVVSTLAAGDSFVLRGVDHSWTNHGPRECELAVILTKPSRWT